MWILRLEISSRKWRVEPQVDGWWHVTIGCNNLCVRGWNPPRCLLPIKHVLLTTNTPFQALKGCHFSGFFGSCQVCIYGILLGIPPLWIPCWGHFNWVVLTMFVVDHYFPSLFIHPKVAAVLIVGWEFKNGLVSLTKTNSMACPTWFLFMFLLALLQIMICRGLDGVGGEIQAAMETKYETTTPRCWVYVVQRKIVLGLYI